MSRGAERWQRVSLRERRGLVVLGIIGMLGWTSLVIYRPQRVKIGKIQNEWRLLDRQRAALRADLPDLKEERGQLERQEAELEQLRQALQRQEASLPSAGALRVLLSTVSKEAQGLQVAFDSIEQHVQEDAEHPTVTIDAAFKAPYEDIVNYLRRLERMTPFLKVARLEISGPKEEAKVIGAVKLQLVMPLTMTRQGDELPPVLDPSSVEKIALPRSPFVSRPRPDAAVVRQDIKVTGITWRGAASTAIVNNEVVRIGDQVDHLMVKQILPDKVVLTDGVDSYTIPLRT